MSKNGQRHTKPQRLEALSQPPLYRASPLRSSPEFRLDFCGAGRHTGQVASLKILTTEGKVLNFTGSNEAIRSIVAEYELYKNASGPNILRLDDGGGGAPSMISVSLIAQVIPNYD